MGKTIDTPVVLTDLVPTLLEAAGMNLSKTVGPLDVCEFVAAAPRRQSTIALFVLALPELYQSRRSTAGAMRSDNWKLVEQFEDGALELYDLATDPSEQKDLAAQDPERAKKMQTELAAHGA